MTQVPYKEHCGPQPLAADASFHFVEGVTHMLTKRNMKGFTLMELMIVMAIIGIMAGIALPHLSKYRKRAYNASAESSAKSAFLSAQARFNENPTDDINSVDTLIAFGYRETDDVTANVTGNSDTLVITTYHASGNKTFTVNAEGNIDS